jgi:hypothetical protein
MKINNLELNGIIAKEEGEGIKKTFSETKLKINE